MSNPKMILEFENENFKDGTNLTVRRGVKWAGIKEAVLKSGEDLTITKTVVIPFKDLADIDLVQEHDPGCRKVKALLKVMKAVYPGFDEREIVTLVFFEFN